MFKRMAVLVFALSAVACGPSDDPSGTEPTAQSVAQADGAGDPEFMAQCAKVTGVLAQLLHDVGGSISAEHGIGLVKKDYLGSTRSAEEIALMRGIRAVMDPAGILNPGKLFD